jgi:hypothetical protein
MVPLTSWRSFAQRATGSGVAVDRVMGVHDLDQVLRAVHAQHGAALRLGGRGSGHDEQHDGGGAARQKWLHCLGSLVEVESRHGRPCPSPSRRRPD